MALIFRSLPLVLVSAGLSGQTAPRPNIVLFLSDDLGWEEVGFNGGTTVPTPNIDRIADEGVKLTQFYVQPSCAPTRASLLTGRHGWKSGVQSRPVQNSDKGMLLDERTIAEALRDVAYKTWIVGKWHLGHWKRAHLPLQRGFDHHYGHYAGLIGSFGHGVGGVLDWHRNGRPVLEEGYSTFLMADEASDLIERHDGASPFFLYIAFNAVHGPHQAPDEYLAKYGKARQAQLECMDVAVGQVIEALEAKGMLDDTLVMFTNDNGAPVRGSNGPYRGFKGSFHEGGVRVPAAVRWPGKIPAGSVSDGMLHIVDLFPTFARLAGASIDSGLPLDGLDAWDTIANGAASPRTEIAFRPDAIRVGDWKLIDRVSRSAPEEEVPRLFNISEDPFEQTNLADDLPDKVAELRERLAHHQSFAREPEPFGKIPNYPPMVYGEDEEAEFGEMLRRRNRTKASIRAAASPVTEGTSATFTVSLNRPAEEPLAVSVSVTESGSMLSGTAPSTVSFETGDTSATLTVPTAIDTVLEAESVVSATLQFGATYTLASRTTARVTVLDDDAAWFAMSAVPEVIKEGESATLTVAISNGVTFLEDQAIDLVASGTASAADYTLTPSALTISAGASSVTAVLAAAADLEEEADETVMVAASLGGDSIGSATVMIESVSHDATLSGLSLSGIDIGTFAAGTIAYTASVPNATTSTTVTAAANHPEADVSISPGAAVSLAEGPNAITIAVTAEDGTTTQTYTVTVTRASLPKVTIAAGASPLTEGTAASFTVTLDQPATEALTVAVEVSESGSALSGTPPASVAFGVGDSSAALSVPTAADSVVEPVSTVTATVNAGTGYTIGEASAASVTVEDDDAATFTLVAEPGAIDEGETSTLTVAISNGVTFAEAQTIALATSGTASAADYAGVPPTLTLPAGASSATAALVAAEDQEAEQAETVTVTASHGGSEIGTATLTIHSISHDATLAALSLSGIDIGTFSGAVTSYRASVANTVTAATVTATATHSGAAVMVEPGSQVALAEGPNEITVTVTAEDGTTRKTYRVTVTRTSLPEVSIAAVQERVSEAELAHFTVSRTGPTTEPLDVRVRSASTTSEEIQTLTVRIGSGERSVTRRVQVGDNTISEDDVTLTWTLADGEDYSVSADHTSASVVLEENDIPEFAVSVEPAEIAEGESATVTVAITNGVTFRQPQTIALSVSGTASASDFTGLPATLTLRAFGSSPSFSATATLTAAVDQQDEEAETVMVTASHNGPAIGSATVTINSISRDATLAALSLSGMDIGTFSAETTAYAASVANSVETTTVTATASHAEASVEIAPGSEVRLAEGENTVTVTVTAEDGTTRTYSVTVTRASLPVASVAAVASRVSEGERAEFRISLTEAAAESLRVGIRWERSDQSQSVTQHTVIRAGVSSKISSFSKSDDKVVREDLTVSITLEDGAGYLVSEDGRSAQVVLEENDAAEFGVSVEPASVAEGETATVQVRTTNGVTFAADQTLALGFAGSTATKGADYSVSAESLTLRAGRRRVTAAVTAIADSDQEDDETVRIEAAHGGEVIGTATLTITGSEPAPEAAGEGFSLAPANASPAGIWSDGETAWVADLADARLYAYRREDGERQAERDIATEPSPMGMWSDGETLWVAHLGGGLRAHRLSDGARLPSRDLALEANAAPRGVWSDGDTVWVTEWLGDTVQAYGLSSGRREAGRDIRLAGGNLMPAGLWSDGQTLWVADWRERVYAYRLSDGSRDFRRDIEASAGDTDPTGLWSGGEALLATGWEGGEVRAYRLAEAAAEAPRKKPGPGLQARAVSLPAVADPALGAAIGAALGKAPGEAVSPQDLAGLEELAARHAGIRDLSGLERAVRLKALDLGFNPLADLRPLAALPALESLNLDGAATDLQALASLPRLQRLSLRHNGIEDLWPLARLTSLTELSLGANRIADLRPLAGLGSLAVLRLDRNRVADLWPLASLAGLEALELEANRVQDLQPLAGLARLRSLALGGNGLTELHALSGLKELADLGLAGNAVEDLGALSALTGLRRLDLRGTAVGDLRPLRGLPSLVWVHVGGSGIADLTPLDGLDGLTAAGRDDLESPSRGRGRFRRPMGLELGPGGH